MFSTSDNELISQRFNNLIAICDQINIYKKDGDRDRIIAAFKFASEAHYGVRRKSGEPYIVHPIAVATISVAEIGLGVKSVIAALLHDVVEDTDYTVEDIERLFGQRVAQMVDGLTKMNIASGLTSSSEISKQAENFKKMLLTLSSDVRVIIIKLADRLHNMRTLGAMSHEKQIKILGETMYLFAPLAHRLGLYEIKSELEDLSLKYSFPDDYKKIYDKLAETEQEREAYIDRLKAPISEKLIAAGITHKIIGRAKSIYSIWKKMQRKQILIDEVFDLFAIRIIFEPVDFVPEKTQCWHIYSIVTDIYKPRPDRLREWINIPKANGYEALHCTVMGTEGRWAEVQIRSKRMDDIAERGFAAHWKYKDSVSKDGELDKWIKEVRDALSSPASDAVEFLDEFKLNLYSSEVIVFTPKGDTRTLPKGATAIDFAYDIHSKIGNSAIGAKINHKIESLFKELESGDQVEIITSNSGEPKGEWLDKVTTTKAQQYIKSYLNKAREDNIEKGGEIFERAMKEMGVNPNNSSVVSKLLIAYRCQHRDDLFNKIGLGIIDIADVLDILKESTASKLVKYWSLQFNNGLKKLGEVASKSTIRHDDSKYKIAECCFPSPGDEVVGFKDDDGVVVVHKKSCEQAMKIATLNGELIVETQWSSKKIISYLSYIKLRGRDRVGILLDLSVVLTKQMNVNIRKINVESNNGVFEGSLSLYVKDDKDLKNIITRISNIKGIEKVERSTQEEFGKF